MAYSVIEPKEKYIIIDKNTNFNLYSDIIEKYPHFNKIIEKKFITYTDIFEFFVDFSGTLKKTNMDNVNIMDAYKYKFKTVFL